MVTGPVEKRPESGCVPLHPPLAMQLLAAVVDHISVSDAVSATTADAALKEMTGSGGGATATLIDALAAPPGPRHEESRSPYPRDPQGLTSFQCDRAGPRSFSRACVCIRRRPSQRHRPAIGDRGRAGGNADRGLGDCAIAAAGRRSKAEQGESPHGPKALRQRFDTAVSYLGGPRFT